MHSHSPRRAGFTLVELLVVIGIIALLISILLPSLNRARLSAKKTLTLSNLRQIGVGTALYQSDDRKQHLPLVLPIDEDERSFLGLALLADKYQLPPAIFLNPQTQDTEATATYPVGTREDGWPVLADIDPVPPTPITLTVPATIDAANIKTVRFHCSFSYDADPIKKAGRRSEPRVYVGDRADYEDGKTFTTAWDGAGICLLWTDGHAEFYKTKSLPVQQDPNIYHHNELNGEGTDERVDDVYVTDETLDTHLRFFSEEEDDALLPD